jgi:hypothetical protein
MTEFARLLLTELLIVLSAPLIPRNFSQIIYNEIFYFLIYYLCIRIRSNMQHISLFTCKGSYGTIL